MNIRKDFVSLLQDQQIWIRTGISVLPGIFSFFLKVQGNPNALYVGIYTSVFVFVFLISVHILTARITLPSVFVAKQEMPNEKTDYKYKTLRPLAVSALSLLIVITLILIFIPPYNTVAKNFVYGTPTPTPTPTLPPTNTPTSTHTSTPNPTATPQEQGIFYMFVLDASLKMTETFEAQTKWDAALRAVDSILVGFEGGANYGLVAIGGVPDTSNSNPCDEPALVDCLISKST